MISHVLGARFADFVDFVPDWHPLAKWVALRRAAADESVAYTVLSRPEGETQSTVNGETRCAAPTPVSSSTPDVSALQLQPSGEPLDDNAAAVSVRPPTVVTEALNDLLMLMLAEVIRESSGVLMLETRKVLHDKLTMFLHANTTLDAGVCDIKPSDVPDGDTLFSDMPSTLSRRASTKKKRRSTVDKESCCFGDCDQDAVLLKQEVLKLHRVFRQFCALEHSSIAALTGSSRGFMSEEDYARKLVGLCRESGIRDGIGLGGGERKLVPYAKAFSNYARSAIDTDAPEESPNIRTESLMASFVGHMAKFHVKTTKSLKQRGAFLRKNDSISHRLSVNDGPSPAASPYDGGITSPRSKQAITFTGIEGGMNSPRRRKSQHADELLARAVDSDGENAEVPTRNQEPLEAYTAFS